jgi:hypothetical protein
MFLSYNLECLFLAKLFCKDKQSSLFDTRMSDEENMFYHNDNNDTIYQCHRAIFSLLLMFLSYNLECFFSAKLFSRDKPPLAYSGA